jgi:hypothetical protein
MKNKDTKPAWAGILAVALVIAIVSCNERTKRMEKAVENMHSVTEIKNDADLIKAIRSGAIEKVIVYNRQLTSEERQRVYTKWTEANPTNSSICDK